MNYVIIRNIHPGNTEKWIDWCKYNGFKKAMLSRVATQGSYKSVVPEDQLREMVRQFKAAGIVVGFHCLSQCIDRSISSPDLITDDEGKPFVINDHYVPREGSELFFEVTQNLSDFYSQNGFDGGIYFDGIDYLSLTTKHGDFWSLGFIATTLTHCKKPCAAECSMGGILNAKYLDYMQAEDQPMANFREWVDAHIKRNERLWELIGEKKIEDLGWLFLNRLPDIADLVYFFQKVLEREAIFGCVLPELDPPKDVKEKLEVVRLFNTFGR
jgi:hypothetical protein